MSNNLVNQGRTAEVFDIGNNQILKLFRKGYPAQAIEDELNIANRIKNYNLPIPKFFGMMEQDNRVGLVYENIKGSPMLGQIMVKPWAFFAYAKQMAEVHSNLHKTKVEGIPRQKAQLEHAIHHCNELSGNTKDKIINELNKLNEGNFLCHGDLHPDNILYSLQGKPFVIDWITATTGNPAGDVARTKVILKYSKAPSHLPLMTRIFVNIFKSILCNAYIKHYINFTGIDCKEIRAWELPIAAARLVENGPKEEKEALIQLINKELHNRHGSNNSKE